MRSQFGRPQLQDGNPFNDTISNSIVLYASQPVQPVYIDGLEGLDLCSTESNCGQTTCVLNNGWFNGVLDDIDWRANSGASPSPTTGPTNDQNIGDSTGKYLYLESSDCFNQWANLYSPCFDLSDTKSPKFQFWFHMRGATIGILHLDIYSVKNRAWSASPIFTLIGEQSVTWRMQQIDLGGYVGDTVLLRFRGNSGQSFFGDMALDHFRLGDLPTAGFGFSQLGGGDSLTVQFTDSSKAATSTTLSFGDGTLIQTTDTTYTYANFGVYTIRQVASNFCGTDTAFQTLELYPTGISDPRSVPMRLFPNPTRSVITLSFDQPAQLKYTLTNTKGQVVKTGFVSAPRSEIDLSGLPSGIYSLETSAPLHHQVYRVVKQ